MPIKYDHLMDKIKEQKPDIAVVIGDLISNKESFQEVLNFIVELSKNF